MTENIILLSKLTVGALTLSILWVLLSAAVLKVTFFPKKKEITDTQTTSSTSSKTQAKKSSSKTAVPKEKELAKKETDTEEKAKKSSEGVVKIVSETSDRADDSNDNAKATSPSVKKDSSKPTLGSLLEGMKFTHGLLLSTAESTEITKHRVYTTTSTKEAIEVGTAFADELTRLGYEIEPLSHYEAKAKRSESSVFMRIEPKAGTALYKGKSRFPRTPHHAVVIEIWLPGARPEEI